MNSIFQSKDEPEKRQGGPGTILGVNFLSKVFEGEGGKGEGEARLGSGRSEEVG